MWTLIIILMSANSIHGQITAINSNKISGFQTKSDCEKVASDTTAVFGIRTAQSLQVYCIKTNK